MNPEIRNYMYHHYGTGYMLSPFYGTHMGYGYPPYGMGFYPSYNPYYHQLDHYMIHLMDHQINYPMAGAYFAEPLGGPAR
ncbi:hypothetical protein [Bacillus xiapuensis]|uniref:Spore coat protein n=1 Tax=Bacillus xiapuensis TaxID=2014075 RepID=A0ABU6NDX0_9BACI|nr:hypothetical protein [Bacillus xiapuensis]